MTSPYSRTIRLADQVVDAKVPDQLSTGGGELWVMETESPWTESGSGRYVEIVSGLIMWQNEHGGWNRSHGFDTTPDPPTQYWIHPHTAMYVLTFEIELHSATVEQSGYTGYPDFLDLMLYLGEPGGTDPYAGWATIDIARGPVNGTQGRATIQYMAAAGQPAGIDLTAALPDNDLFAIAGHAVVQVSISDHSNYVPIDPGSLD